MAHEASTAAGLAGIGRGAVASEPTLAPSPHGYVASAADGDRLRYLMRFAELAPAWSPWSAAPERRATFCVHEGGERTDGYADLETRDARLVGSRRDRRRARTRELGIGDGAALYHLRLALEAFGDRFTVEDFPLGPEGGVAARVTLDGRTSPSAAALRTLTAAVRLGASDLPVQMRMVPAASVKALANECLRERVTFRVIVGDERDALARIVMDADRATLDEAHLTANAPLLFAVTTKADSRLDWLIAGQAMAALFARAKLLDLSLALMTAPVDDAAARAAVARVIRTEQVVQLLFRVVPPA